MNSMENFFNWVTTPVPKEEVIIWFNIHNMNFEKIELYGDIFKSLTYNIMETYLGEDTLDTKIILTNEDNILHFKWCWNKMIEDFRKENIIIKIDGRHKDYFELFFLDTFYNQKEKYVKNAIPKFLLDIFNMDEAFTKSDLDLLSELYKLLEKNIE